MPEIETNGITLHYRDTGGEGRPVVLVHGWPTSGDSWEPQVHTLRAAGFRVITYDRRGFGSSDKPADGYDYDTLTDDLAGIMDGLDLADATLVGFSMGGGEVVRYLAAYGDGRVVSAVLAGAVQPFLLLSSDNPAGGMSDEQVEAMKAGVAQDRKAFLEGFTTALYSADGILVVDEEQRQATLALQQPARDEALVGCIEAFTRTDLRDDLDGVTVPVLVVHGDRDAIVPAEVSGRRSAEALPHGRFVLVEGAPHGLHVSHADEFNKVLLDFLAS